MKKIIFLFLISAALSSCNSMQVVYDYDQKANFSRYTTYGLFPDLRSGLNQLDEGRLISSLDKGLKAKGLQIADTPDMYVNVYTEQFQKNNGNSIGLGIGGGGNVGVGVSGGIPIGGPENYLKLTFDFINVEKDALIWQAVVESKFDRNASPQERQETFNKIVAKALSGYPPKK